MFCTKCGKEIAADSVFCEFCGTKVEVKSAPSQESQPKKNDTPQKKQAEEITNKTLQQMASHLEFLGYEIERLEIGENKEWVAARHPQSNNYLFFELLPNFILFQVSLRTDKKSNSKMDEAINKMNKALAISRVYYEVDEDKKVLLRIESVYSSDYQKERFARFRDTFESEQKMLSNLEEFQAFV